MKSKLKNVGQIPGSVIYTGDKMTAESTVYMIAYNSEVKETKVKDFNECRSLSPHAVTWIDFVGIDQTNDIQEIGQVFDLHPLTLEDIANAQQRPKIDDMEDYIFMSLKKFEYHNTTQVLDEEQISLVLGKTYLISFQEKHGNDDFEVIKERIRKSKWRIRKMWSDYLLYSLMDTIVDSYFVILEKIEDDIELLQDELLNSPNQNTLPKIQSLKHNLIILRKSIRPVREMISSLQRFESRIFSEELDTYLRDLYDHTVQIADTLDTFKDTLSGSLDIYLSSLSNKMNGIMKVLTIISTIFIPMTFITGFFGMNFKYMPDFMGNPLSYLWFFGLMVLLAGGMVMFFKRKNRF